VKNENPKKDNAKLRIALTDRSREVLRSWQKQLVEKYPGIKISEADLVNWCIAKQQETLATEDVADVENLHFDTVKRLEWMLAEAKAAKSRGLLPLTASHGKPTSSI
jgi:hypothetical protein